MQTPSTRNCSTTYKPAAAEFKSPDVPPAKKTIPIPPAPKPAAASQPPPTVAGESRINMYKRLTQKEVLFLPPIYYCNLSYMEDLCSGKKKLLRREEIMDYDPLKYVKYDIKRALDRWFSAVEDYVPERRSIVSLRYFLQVVNTVLSCDFASGKDKYKGQKISKPVETRSKEQTVVHSDPRRKEELPLQRKRVHPASHANAERSSNSPDVEIISEEEKEPPKSRPCPAPDESVCKWMMAQYVANVLRNKPREHMSELEKSMLDEAVKEDGDMAAKMLAEKWGAQVEMHFTFEVAGPTTAKKVQTIVPS